MPASYWRCAYRSSYNTTGALVVNSFHVELDALSGPINPATVATDVHAWLGSTYKATISQYHTLHDLTVTEETYPGSDVLQGVHSIEEPGVRSVADTYLDAGLCILLALKTNTPKRYARGHFFMPPAMGSAAADDGGTWKTSNAYWSTTNAFADAYLAPHTAGDNTYSPIIFSRRRVQLAATPFIFPVVGAIARREQHFLRKRTTAP